MSNKRVDTRVSPASARDHGIGLHSPRPSIDTQPRTNALSPTQNDAYLKRRTSRQNKFLNACAPSGTPQIQQSPKIQEHIPGSPTISSTEFGDVSQIIDEGWIDEAIDTDRSFLQPDIHGGGMSSSTVPRLVQGINNLGIIDNLNIRMNDQDLFLDKADATVSTTYGNSESDEYEESDFDSTLDAAWFEDGGNSPTNQGQMKPLVPRKVATGGKWGKEEDISLREIVMTHGAKNWRNVAELLGV